MGLYGLITGFVRVNYGFFKPCSWKAGFLARNPFFRKFGEKPRLREKPYKKIGFRFARIFLDTPMYRRSAPRSPSWCPGWGRRNLPKIAIDRRVWWKTLWWWYGGVPYSWGVPPIAGWFMEGKWWKIPLKYGRKLVVPHFLETTIYSPRDPNTVWEGTRQPLNHTPVGLPQKVRLDPNRNYIKGHWFSF